MKDDFFYLKSGEFGKIRRINMKNLIAIIMGMALLFATNNIFAERNKSKVESPEIKAKIESLILDAERKLKNPFELNRAIKKVNNQLLGYWNSDIFVSNETKRDVTIKLINIFNKTDDFETNGANKKRIIETIGLNDNSSEAHKFFLSLLKSENKKHRDHALWSLNPTGVHGNDIYNEIKNLMEKGIIERGKYLYALKSANSSRALPEIQKFIKKTNNLKEFVGNGLLLCSYNDPNAIDVLIDRYLDLKNTRPKNKKGNQKHINPVDAFSYKTLIKYVEAKEGEKIKKVIIVLKDEGLSGNRDLPILAKKLKSDDIMSREVIIEFLVYQMNNGSVKKDKGISFLEEAERNEKDKELKVKIKKK